MAKKKRSFDQINKARRPRTRTEWIPLDTELLAQIEELEQEIRQAKREDERQGNTAAARAPRLEMRREELRAEADAAAVRFTASSLPRREYRRLIEESPSTDKDRRWDDDLLAPKLISACITEPEGADGRVIWEDWDEGTALTIYRLCLLVNEEPPKVPFSVSASEPMDGSPTSSTSASETAEV